MKVAAHKSDSSWMPGAKEAVQLARAWSKKVTARTKCRVRLFGSAIYKSGEQFDPTTSDLDIICIFPEDAGALKRVSILQELLELKRELENAMIPLLNRTSCVEPGVSIVALTVQELRADVHKSGVRWFFRKNYFYDFSLEKAEYLKEAGAVYMPDANRHALEYVQKVRNEYLSISANDVGGLENHKGTDPVPKSLMRAAAQLNLQAEEGEWYDTMHGLDWIQDRVRALRDKDPQFRALADCLSVRRGARGRLKELLPEQQLLLNEILADEALASGVEELVRFHLHLSGFENPGGELAGVNSVLSEIAPSAWSTNKFVGSGRINQLFWAPQSTLERLKRLSRLNVLAPALNAKEASILPDDLNEEQLLGDGLQSRAELLEECIKKWVPSELLVGRALEDSLYAYLCDAIRTINGLQNGSITNNSDSHKWRDNGVDFILEWTHGSAGQEVIGIEVTRASTGVSMFDKLAKFKSFGKPLLFVLAGGERMLKNHQSDLQRHAELHPNVRVFAVDIASSVPGTGFGTKGAKL